MKNHRRWAVWTKDEEDKDWQFCLSVDTRAEARLAVEGLQEHFRDMDRRCETKITRHGWASVD